MRTIRSLSTRFTYPRTCGGASSPCRARSARRACASCSPSSGHFQRRRRRETRGRRGPSFEGGGSTRAGGTAAGARQTPRNGLRAKAFTSNLHPLSSRHGRGTPSVPNLACLPRIVLSDRVLQLLAQGSTLTSPDSSTSCCPPRWARQCGSSSSTAPGACLCI